MYGKSSKLSGKQTEPVSRLKFLNADHENRCQVISSHHPYHQHVSFDVNRIYTQEGSLYHAQYSLHGECKQHMPRLGLTARERLSRTSNERVQTYTVQWWARFPTLQNTLKSASPKTSAWIRFWIRLGCDRGRAKGALADATTK